MEIRIAKNIGFCFGVRRAVELAQKARDDSGIAYTLGELIHNEAMIEELKAENIIPVKSLDDIEKGGTVVVRSHGVPRSVLDEASRRGFVVVDATCPFVRRIQNIAADAHENGKPVIIIGMRNHPEVVGINGCCENSAHIIATPDEVKALPDMESPCVVVQTTFSTEAYDEIIAELKRRYSSLCENRTICDTTAERQKEAVRLSKECDEMVVIGSKNSSNTQKLFQLCKKNCKLVHSIENINKTPLVIANIYGIIGLVAGASTPDPMIREVITRMNELETTTAKQNEIEAAVTETAADKATAAKKTATKPAETPVKKKEEPEVKKNLEDMSFEEAIDQTLRRIHNGQVLKGIVVQIADGEICVNIGYKADGIIPRSEFSNDPTEDPAAKFKIGDEIEVEVVKVNDGEGNVLLSRKNIESKLAWERFASDENIEEKVFDAIGKEVVKGGLVAYISGIRAFVPASMLSNKYIENIGDFVNKPLRLKIIEIDHQRKRIVASQKAVLEVEAAAERKRIRESLQVGAKINGVVRRITTFGAFVDIGGLDGLVHITDCSWGRPKHPSEVLKVGQEIEVVVLGVDNKRDRVSLGYKQLQPKPWDTAAERYPVGSIVEGKVVRIVPFGAFVALESTIDGLIHVSQVAARRIENVESELNIGDVVRCKVLDVNPTSKRISLSRREVILEENPEIAEEIAREKAEREERIAAEREERRAAAEKTRTELRAKQDSERSERPSRVERDRSNSEHTDRERRRPRREESDYQLPPVEQSTTSLAGLLSNFTVEKDD